MKDLNKRSIIFFVVLALVAGFGILLISGINPIYLAYSFLYQGPEPQIELNTSVSGTINSTHTFRAGSENITIIASADAQVYYGAQESIQRFMETYPLFVPIDRYYNAMMNDELENDFYEQLLHQFRNIKAEQNLSDDQYVELLAAYVQSIPYDFNSTSVGRYPVNTAVLGKGDCDDKSILLASLLSREGYAVSIIGYLDARHMCVGIRTNEIEKMKIIEPDYANRLDTTLEGYYEIETTCGSLIPCDYSSNSEINPEYEYARIVSIGNGVNTYNSGEETIGIYNYYFHLDEILNSTNDTTSTLYQIFEDLNKSFWDGDVNAFDRTSIYQIIGENPLPAD